jgi:hypothetical protein
VRAFDWCFRNRETGEITIAQFPNLPLWLFVGASLLARAVDGDLHAIARGAATGSLAWWAADELVRGVNPWRRALGVGGLGLVAARLAR